MADEILEKDNQDNQANEPGENHDVDDCGNDVESGDYVEKRSDELSEDDFFDDDIPGESSSARHLQVSIVKDQSRSFGSQVVDREKDLSVLDEEDEDETNFVTVKSLIDGGLASPLKNSNTMRS